MTLGLFGLAVALGVPLCAGLAFTRSLAVFEREDLSGRLGQSLLTGNLLLALFLIAWGWSPLSYHVPAARIVPGLLALACLVVSLRPKERGTRPPRGKEWALEVWFFRGVLVLVAVGLADRILISSLELVSVSDEAHIWASKAKAIFCSDGFGEAFRQTTELPTIVSHRDYPPLNSMIQLWSFVVAGEITHVENRLGVQVFLFAYLFLVASALRRRLRPGVAALFLACLGTLGFVWFSAQRAYSDLLVGLGVFVLWDMLARVEEERDTRWLVPAGLVAAFLLWSKNEGLLVLLATAVALGVRGTLLGPRSPVRFGRRGWAALAGPALVSFGYLTWFNRRFDFRSDLLQGYMRDVHVAKLDVVPGFFELVARNGADHLPVVLSAFLEHMAQKPEQTRLLLLAFVIVGVLVAGGRNPRARTLALALFLVLAGYVAVYLGTYRELVRHLDTSAHRLLFQVLPASGLWLAQFVAQALPWARAQERELRASEPSFATDSSSGRGPLVDSTASGVSPPPPLGS